MQLGVIYTGTIGAYMLLAVFWTVLSDSFIIALIVLDTVGFAAIQ